MSSTKYPYQNEVIYAIVVGGDSEDPAPDKAGGFRARVPGQYGPNVLNEHLPFIRMLTSGTQDGVVSFNPPPERGSAIMAMKVGGHSGTGHMVALGVLPNDVMKSMGVPGGKSLNTFFEEAINHVTNKKAPPKNLINTVRDGAQIRQVTDDKMWSNSLVRHIPSTGTGWPMSGIPLPAVNNINTAIQHFNGILSNSVLSQLPGGLMSLGTMFNQLRASGALQQVLDALPDEMVGAMESMANLIPSIEIQESAGFSVGGRVHEPTYLANAVLLLSQCRTLADVMDVLFRLQWDVELFGQDQLGDVNLTVDTPFGDLEINISYDGKVTPNVNMASVLANTAPSDTEPPAQKNMKGFLNIMTSPSQAFAMSGSNLFGESAKQKFDMYNRMNPGALGTAKSLIETLNTGEKEVSGHKVIAGLVRDGGKLLSGKGFK